MIGADWSLLLALNQWAAHPIGAAVATFLSSYWVPAAVLVALSALALKRRRPIVVVVVLLSLGLGDLAVSRVLKPWVDRPRPCHTKPELLTPDGCGPGRSFPSGHATNAFAVATASGVLWPTTLWAMAPVAFLVAGSRVVLGVHFPSDVVGGAFLGILLGGLLGFAGRRAVRRWSRTTPLETPGGVGG